MIKRGMKLTIFADSGFVIATKKDRQQIFLEEINAVGPWASLVGIFRGYVIIVLKIKS
jgi:hypothetical protein